MNDIIPWDEWVALIQPLYDKGNRGRLLRGIETMLRMYLVQIWFNLSDEGVKGAIYLTSGDGFCKFYSMLIEARPIYPSKLRFSANGQTATATHARTVNHNGVHTDNRGGYHTVASTRIPRAALPTDRLQTPHYGCSASSSLINAIVTYPFPSSIT